jgi:hypothetical protein
MKKAKEELIIRSNSSVNVFARVYEQAPPPSGFSGWFMSNFVNTYVPRSNLIEIAAFGEQKFEIESATTLRWVYYIEAKNAELALQQLTDTGPTLSIRGQHVGVIEPNSFATVKIIIPESYIKIFNNESAHSLKRGELSDKVLALRKNNELKQKQIDELQSNLPRVVIATDPSGDIALSTREEEFSKERDAICQSSMRRLVLTNNNNFPADASMQRLSLCGSGGGFRAMLAFHGFQAGLQQEGLLDMISYVCGTSGSTWAMGDILANGGDPVALENLPQRIEKPLQRGVLSIMDFSSVENLYTNMLAEGPPEENTRSYNGFLLGWKGRLSVTALSGIAPKNPGDEDIRLKALYEHKINPQFLPLPIFNMIASTELFTYKETSLVNQLMTDTFDKTHTWDHVELTPFDTTLCPDKDDRGKPAYPAWRIETRCLGRHYDDQGIGLVENSPLPLSLASTIGIAGSALTVDWQKMIQEYAQVAAISIVTTHVSRSLGIDLNNDPNLLRLTAGAHKHSLDPAKPTETEQVGLISGFFTTRPVPGRGGKNMVLRDAGFNYNVQMFQVMRTARKCGIAIVFDASSDLNEHPGNELFKAIEDAKSLQRKLPIELTDKELFNNKVQNAIRVSEFPIVFGNPADPEEFCVAYIPCVKTRLRNKFFDTPSWSHYDPMAISISKLDYEPEEAQMLHGYGKRLGLHVSSKIKDIVAQRILAVNKLDAPECAEPREKPSI